MPRPPYRRSGNLLGLPAQLWDSPFLRTCRGEPVSRAPVWLMRQAGRYMQHYRGLRAAHSFLDLCKDPDLACEVTVYAREWLGVDAAIIFSDILVVPEALGLRLEFTAGEGPRLPDPLRTPADLARLREPAQAGADLGFVSAAIRRTVAALPPDIPLIGFAGAPFTLAAYAIEGGGSRQFAHAKAFMYAHPQSWHALQARLVDCLSVYLADQVAAGASALQLFDSWAGCLTREDFREFVQPHLSALVGRLPAGVPVILFATNAAHLLDLIAGCGADVVGLDPATEIADGWRRCGGPAQVAVQGNLDPALLLAPRPRLLAAADRLLAGWRPGHIVNLGHGVLKETDPEQARALVERIHAFTPPSA